ncbi:hypothetical protein BKA70DRAFT_1482677 [Coprinopsis sp. MPI-PUGE-AT-0042]|nr:hypothetical protein BKA70DRAFT_1482677 [Coprinopsis sp. MPI-PUGE-AT-0042]
MASDPHFHSYTTSNAPLPDHLHERLNKFLDRLDAQWATHEHDMKHVVEAIDSRRSMIEALEREIDTFSRLKARISEGQKNLMATKRRYATLATAFRRIPPEVIARVLEFAVEGPDDLMHQTERIFFSQLRSVCRLWRQTSFSTPSLWRGVGVDIGQITQNSYGYGIEGYLWRNLTNWFRRAGEAAPLKLQVYGPVPRTASGAMNFASSGGLNITTLAFCTPRGVQPTGDLPYSSLEVLGVPTSRPLRVEDLTFEFQHRPLFQPSQRDVVDLTHNFPALTRLCLVESTLPVFAFPLQIVHGTLVELHLANMVLSSIEIYLLLSGLPRLETLHLEHCEGRSVPSSFPTSFSPCNHLSLHTLFLSETIPEECLIGLTCPGLRSVSVEGTPSFLYPSNIGQTLGQFIQRSACGHPAIFCLPEVWQNELLENVLDGNTALRAVAVGSFSSFKAPPTSGRPLVKIPPSLLLIVVWQDATKSQLVDFCDLVLPAEAQAMIVYVPNCLPFTSAYYPWPRPESGRNYILCHVTGLETWAECSRMRS